MKRRILIIREGILPHYFEIVVGGVIIRVEKNASEILKLVAEALRVEGIK